ncbi:hypothetical protein MNEG_14124 [Monoraphidium neglectum]|uniref:UBX domain-containing protein n=1 Tax=Monoraphidium neglectum TaxID=145388 RepID=A0A0D2LQ18_9CHLO|nr:hypothetical protein MNEG_14124 [Monoraphidium neglectum]KIY93839.1 hypothetical protein MNEG_14124 [Monoraphidium neglectum]|eukprot:XP_013892859.1 hypothetical protein MNEG_14124 [Monoraphidium neglectum]
MHESAADYEARQSAYEASLEENIKARERQQQEERLAALREARALREQQDEDYRAALEEDRRKQALRAAGGGGGGGGVASPPANPGLGSSSAPSEAARPGPGATAGPPSERPAPRGRLLGGAAGAPSSDPSHLLRGQGDPRSVGSGGGRGRTASHADGGAEGRAQDAQAEESRLLSLLPPEPSQDAADAITLRVRMPGGPPHARRFLPEQTVADALAWVRCFLSGDASGGGKLNLAAGLFSGAVRPELLLQPAATLGEVAGSARQLTLFAAVGAQRAGG